MEEAKNLIIYTVGGTPEPLIKSILTYKPEVCYFICSKETEAMVTKILTEAQTREQSLILTHHLERVKSHEDILECYKTAHLTVRKARRNYPNHIISIDYTGGTKSMTAGLALAGARFGIGTFKYVGGDLRDQYGRVVTGHEYPINRNNPFHEFIIEDIEEAVAFFNNYHFEAAERIFKKSQMKVDDKRIKLAAKLAAAFGCWDKFKYGTSLAIFNEADALIEAMLRAEVLPSNFLKNLKVMEDPLAHLVFKWGGKINPSYDPNLEALDMVCNAERRSEMERYDDAVIRGYRAIEMIIGATLEKKYGLDMSYPNWMEFERSYPGKEDKFLLRLERTELPIRLSPLLEVPLLLQVLEDPIGNVIYDKMQNMTTLQTLRNKLKTIHGSWIATKKDGEQSLEICKDFIASWLQLDRKQLEEQLKHLRFPKLLSEYMIL